MTETNPKITAGIDVGKVTPGTVHQPTPAPPKPTPTTRRASPPSPWTGPPPEPIGPGGVRTHRRLRASLGNAAPRWEYSPAGYIPTGCTPTPGPAGSKPRPTAWTLKSSPATAPPLICPPTRPPKPRTPECVPCSKTCSGGENSWQHCGQKPTGQGAVGRGPGSGRAAHCLVGRGDSPLGKRRVPEPAGRGPAHGGHAGSRIAGARSD